MKLNDILLVCGGYYSQNHVHRSDFPGTAKQNNSNDKAFYPLISLQLVSWTAKVNFNSRALKCKGSQYNLYIESDNTFHSKIVLKNKYIQEDLVEYE